MFLIVLYCLFLDYHYKGCFAYRESLESIHKVIIEDPLLTPQRCLTKCSKRSTHYFIVTRGHICVCISAIDSLTKHGESNECTSPCSGNNQQLCGGEFAIDIYTSKNIFANAIYFLRLRIRFIQNL